jgi:hypothetical protein
MLLHMEQPIRLQYLYQIEFFTIIVVFTDKHFFWHCWLKWVHIFKLYLLNLVYVGQTWFIRYIYHWNLQFLNNVIIIKANVFPFRHSRLSCLGILVFTLLKTPMFAYERTWWSYSRNISCPLNYICTLYVCFNFFGTIHLIITYYSHVDRPCVTASFH